MDEIWGFCYSKEKNVPADKKGTFSTMSLRTVSLDTSTIRAVERTEAPSQRAEMIAARFGVLSTFAILDIMRERVGKVNTDSA